MKKRIIILSTSEYHFGGIEEETSKWIAIRNSENYPSHRITSKDMLYEDETVCSILDIVEFDVESDSQTWKIGYVYMKGPMKKVGVSSWESILLRRKLVDMSKDRILDYKNYRQEYNRKDNDNDFQIAYVRDLDIKTEVRERRVPGLPPDIQKTEYVSIYKANFGYVYKDGECLRGKYRYSRISVSQRTDVPDGHYAEAFLICYKGDPRRSYNCNDERLYRDLFIARIILPDEFGEDANKWMEEIIKQAPGKVRTQRTISKPARQYNEKLEEEYADMMRETNPAVSRTIRERMERLKQRIRQ